MLGEFADGMKRGLYSKFKVSRVDGSSRKGRKHAKCSYFVLDLDHDPLAVPALEAYAGAARKAGFIQLAEDLERWIKKAKEGK